ncbi:hypothetical protein NDA14_004945 [Ustilago hordei]|nr:hypothetical protein NDA14_004945 [Ustilago hordei]
MLAFRFFLCMTFCADPVTVCSKATARTTPHPRKLGYPLELVSMDVMGPLHKSPQYSYILVIHDAYSGMIWIWGLTSKAQATTEALWWILEVHQAPQHQASKVMLAQSIKEIRVDQGELWTTVMGPDAQKAGRTEVI